MPRKKSPVTRSGIDPGTFWLVETTYPYYIKISQHPFIMYLDNITNTGRDSVEGIATGYRLDGPRIESLLGEFFQTRPYRPWGPPSPLYIAYRLSFPGLKGPVRGVHHPLASIAEVKERVQLYFYSPCGPSWHILGRRFIMLPISASFYALICKVQIANVHHDTILVFHRISSFFLIFRLLGSAFVEAGETCSAK
jgi:hypothetical protein